MLELLDGPQRQFLEDSHSGSARDGGEAVSERVKTSCSSERQDQRSERNWNRRERKVENGREEAPSAYL